jgi:hypothetical protein
MRTEEVLRVPVDEYGAKTLIILYNRAVGISFYFLKLQTEKQLKNIIKNMALNVNGLPKFRLLLKEARVRKDTKH